MVECLIIGGGVIGLSLAYEMARKGQKVRILERSEPGQEASWAGAGILATANLDTATDPYERLRGLSTRLHSRWAEQLREETGIDNGYHCCGGIRIARCEEERANLRETLQWYSQHNIPARELTPEELLELEPKLSFPVHQNQILSALHLPLETQLRNPRHLKALISACLKRGVEISSGTVVEDFEIRRGRVEAVKINDFDVQGKKYLLHQRCLESSVVGTSRCFAEAETHSRTNGTVQSSEKVFRARYQRRSSLHCAARRRSYPGRINRRGCWLRETKHVVRCFRIDPVRGWTRRRPGPGAGRTHMERAQTVKSRWKANFGQSSRP